MKCTAVPFNIWRSLIEKAGYKVEDIPNTWDAFLDFFMPVQDKLRAQGMRNIYAYGYQLTANGVDPGILFQAFLMAYGGKGLVTPDGKLHTEDPHIREAAIKAIEKLTTPYKGMCRRGSSIGTTPTTTTHSTRSSSSWISTGFRPRSRSTRTKRYTMTS